MIKSLLKIKERLLDVAKEAASNKDVTTLVTVTTIIRDIEDDIAQAKGIYERGKNALAVLNKYKGVEDKTVLEQDDASAENEVSSTPREGFQEAEYSHIWRTQNISHGPSVMKDGKERARDARIEFEQKCRNLGVVLTQIEKVVFRSVNGKKIVVPYASCRKADGWFLGIKDGRDAECPYDLVTVLCQKDATKDEVYTFHLTKMFMQKYWSDFSRNGSDVKLNISKDGPNFYLMLPPRRREQINIFLENWDNIVTLSKEG